MKKRGYFILLFVCFSAVFAYAQKNLTLISKTKLSGPNGAGLWHYIDTTGKAYAIAGTSSSVVIIDISTPATPKIKFEVPVNKSIWQEVCVWGKYAYCGTEGGGGITIIDLSKLPAPTVNTKKYTGDGVIAGKISNSHTVKAFNGYLYINGSAAIPNGGTIICSLADPWNPKYVGKYDLKYVHDCDVRNDTMYTSEANVGNFGVVDIKSKTAPKLMASQATPFKVSHNSGLSGNGKIIYTTDEVEKAPLTSYDISDLGNIKLLDKYYTTEIPDQEVHNVRVLNDYLVNACYGDQVTIVDAHKPDNLVEIANYRTGTGAVWDVDPYLPSGLVIALNNSANLFVFQPNYVRACYLEGIVRDSITGMAINKARVEILTTKIIDSTLVAGSYKTGYSDAGTYDIRFSKPGYVTRTINGVKLTAGGVTTLNVKLLKLNLSTHEQSNQNNIMFYPNPVHCNLAGVSFHIKGLSDAAKIHYSVFNMVGEQIQSGTIPGHGSNFEAKLNIADITSGIYLIKIQNDDNIWLRKLIVQ